MSFPQTSVSSSINCDWRIRRSFSSEMLWCKNFAKTNLFSLFSCMSTPPSSLFVLHMENIWCLTLPHPHQTLEKIWNVSSIKEFEPYFLHIWLHFANKILATSSNHGTKPCIQNIADSHQFPSTLCPIQLLWTSFSLWIRRWMPAYLFISDLHQENLKGGFSWGEKKSLFWEFLFPFWPNGISGDNFWAESQNYIFISIDIIYHEKVVGSWLGDGG